MSVERVKDKRGEDINVGDDVWTRYRGGSHEGEVEKIVMDQAEAREENVANPPKVIFQDQHGHRVAHNPSTLQKTD
ncbi:DUF2945 domain-containing protein [Aspergillus clavatus NRRL 1]|uniref:Hypervirulence associated protein TUDOR domain-containing protein n=1 Tax=Aspergillus clavatus (strain ATCC 1007 / CBS 513.65 / DSM 816 / NCTC 3887 / NRRL 1 / QM 1276 / 107) TaxID=344612 RepID=A1CD89_ASPCL|nr:uncharacterized protein ACLA_005720 [Aspergillus clavatus NRRL 1]EAW11816.1 conserved hypothetical protein [Aspergillus clavatus NRRL 1]